MGKNAQLLNFPEQIPAKIVDLSRRELGGLHLAVGKRLLIKREYARAARELAVAYTFDRRPEILIEVGRACRKADMDDMAEAVFARLQEEFPGSDYQRELAEALKSLSYKSEDSEINLTQLVRQQMNVAKQQFQAGHYADAVAEYALVYSIKSLPRLVFNSAQAYRRAGRAREAYVLYSSFLAEDPETPVKKETVGYLQELRAAAFPPPIYKRSAFWIPLASIVVAGVALGLGLGYGLRQQKVVPPDSQVLQFNFP